MQHQDRLIWFNGALMAPAEAKVPVLSPTAQFGLNVFEGIRGYWSAAGGDLYLFRLAEHLERLMASCKLMGIDSPHSPEAITDAIRAVLRANAYRCDVAVRATLFVAGDEGSWSTSAPVGMFVAPIAKDRRPLEQVAGARACVSTWERIDDRSLPPRIKAGANYINGRYAHLEAQANGYDLSPCFWTRLGKVSEGGWGLPDDGARWCVGDPAGHGLDLGEHHPGHASGAGRGGGYSQGGAPHRPD